MDISQEIEKLKAEQTESLAIEKKAHDRAKFEAILGNGQKGVAE